jgi:Protein of unknown function (DUF3617)
MAHSSPSFSMRLSMRTPARALLAVAFVATAGTALADNPQPGKWSQQTSVSSDGQRWKAVPPSQSCLTAAQASQSVEQRLQLMVSQAVQSGCRAVDVKTGDGHAKGRFECQQPGTPATVDVDGSYSGDRYEMTLVGTNLADRNGSGVVIPKMYMKYEGRHVGACGG